jgi:hypothetical protein
MPVLRDTPTRTISEVKAELAETRKSSTEDDFSLADIHFRFADNNPHFQMGSKLIPASATGINAFASYFQIPTAYLNRVSKDLGIEQAGNELDMWKESAASEAVRVTFNDDHILDIREPGRQLIERGALLDIAASVMGTEQAPIVRLINTQEEFAFDVHVPFDYDRGVGGDVKVNDITAGGIGIHYDAKMNLAPTVERYLHRLACTNGMRRKELGMKVDARGQTVDEVLAEVGALAEQLMSGVESDIRHFYELRERPVDNPERQIIALARDFKIPDRSTKKLLHLASTEEMPDNPSEFDVLNLVTNLANHPEIRNDGGRLLLERVGGGIIADQAARCGHCRQTVPV